MPFLSGRLVLCNLLSSRDFGSKLLSIVFATKFEYRLNPSALGFDLPGSLTIIPSFVLKGYAIPEPNTLVRMLLSLVISLHFWSTSYCVKGTLACSCIGLLS